MPITPTPPYLPLRSPRSDLCLTTWLPSDAPQKVPILNDISVASFLSGPPYPYTLGMAQFWVSHYDERISAGEEIGGLCVLRPIKSLLEDDEPTFIGTITLSTNPFGHISDPDRRKEMLAENAARMKAGVSSRKGGKSWSLGFFLDPRWKGKGAMKAACTTYLNDYAIPTLGVHPSCISASAFTTNGASLKIQQSASFQLLFLARAAAPIAESKGGGVHDIWCSALTPEGVTREELEQNWIWDGGRGLERV